MGLDYLSWGYDEVLPLVVKPQAWHAKRRKGLGGSDANIIMSGDEGKVIRLWCEKRGKAATEDLSDVLPVLMGTVTEPLNRYIYTKRTGRKVTAAGKSRTHQTHKFMRLSLDGMTTTESGEKAIWEGKHVNPFNFNIDITLAKYQPQLQHAMLIMDVPYAVLSVLVGTMQWDCLEVPADADYQELLVEREKAFWHCVQTNTPPADLPEVVSTPKREGVLRTVDMTGNNLFGNYAAQWIETKEPASKFGIAEKNLKELIEPDVGLATGYGINVKRDKAGRLRIAAT